MAVKTGTSHAASTLVMTLISVIMVQYLKQVRFFESIFELNEYLARQFAAGLHLLAMVYIPVQIVEFLIIAFVLSFFWGIAYHFSRFR